MEIKDRIIQGVRELFLKYGVKSVTMDDIARHLGISKKTIYQYFENKDVLVTEVSRIHLEEEEGYFEAIAKSSLDPIDEILKLSDHIRSSFANLNPSLLYEVEKYYPEAWKIYLKHKNSCITKNIITNLEKGIQQGLYRKELNVHIIATIRLEEIQLGFNPTVFPSATFNHTEVQVQLFDHFLHGICTLKGHKLINKYKQITEEE